jgi:hypothetical protein
MTPIPAWKPDLAAFTPPNRVFDRFSANCTHNLTYAVDKRQPKIVAMRVSL